MKATTAVTLLGQALGAVGFGTASNGSVQAMIVAAMGLITAAHLVYHQVAGKTLANAAVKVRLAAAREAEAKQRIAELDAVRLQPALSTPVHKTVGTS